jgi:hypothetical protein
MKLVFPHPTLEKILIEFQEKSVQRERVVPCERTAGETDMTKLIVAVRNFTNAPQTGSNTHNLGKKSKMTCSNGKDKYYTREITDGLKRVLLNWSPEGKRRRRKPN